MCHDYFLTAASSSPSRPRHPQTVSHANEALSWKETFSCDSDGKSSINSQRASSDIKSHRE